MAKTVKVPSLQHMARNLRDTPEGVRRKLVALAKRPPQFSYGPLFAAVRDMLVFGIPYAQVVEGIRRAEKRPWVRELLIEVLPLIGNHFAGIEPDSPPRRVARRYYPLARDILIPFEAPFEYSVGGQIYFPWFSFWRSNPLADRRLSLFVTIVEEVLLQDADLDRALFQILDFSIPKASANGDSGSSVQRIFLGSMTLRSARCLRSSPMAIALRAPSLQEASRIRQPATPRVAPILARRTYSILIGKIIGIYVERCNRGFRLCMP